MIKNINFLLFQILVTITLFKYSIQYECNQSVIHCETCTAENGTECSECKTNLCNEYAENYPTCDVEAVRTLTPDCSCPEKYRDLINELNQIIGCELDCPIQCKTCELNSIDKCSECKDENMLPPNCYFPIHGYFLGSDGEEQKCDTKCEHCENNSTNCITYQAFGSSITLDKCAGENRDGEKSCNCDIGYYDNQGNLQDCIKCPDGCLQCESASKCEQCDEAKFLVANQFTGQCECLPGFRIFDEKVGCEKCYQLSDVCVQDCPQHTVKDETNQVCETLQYNLVSNSSLILAIGILLGLIQVSLCCFVYACLKKKHSAMEKMLHDEQMKIKAQRDHIYKNLNNFKSDLSQSNTRCPKTGTSKNKSEDEIQDLSQSNLQSSQMNLFQRENSKSHLQLVSNSNIDLDDIQNTQQQLNQEKEALNPDDQLDDVGGGRRRKRRQI